MRFAFFSELSGRDLGGSTHHRRYAPSVLHPVGVVEVRHSLAEDSSEAESLF